MTTDTRYIIIFNQVEGSMGKRVSLEGLHMLGPKGRLPLLDSFKIQASRSVCLSVSVASEKKGLKKIRE